MSEDDRLVPRRTPSMDDKSPPSPTRLTQEEYDSLLAQGLNPTVHNPDGSYRAQTSLIDGITDAPLKQKSAQEKRTADLNKLGKETYMTLLNVATLQGLARAVERIHEKVESQWLVERARRDNAVVYAHMHKEHLGDNYWHGEFVARQRVVAAQNFLTIIEEMRKEEENVARKYGKESLVDGNSTEREVRSTEQTEQGHPKHPGVGYTPTPDGSAGRDTASPLGSTEPPQNNNNS